MYFFTADEHYFHSKIIKYCNRPFDDVDQMNSAMIDNHNKIVKSNDITIHAGDFSFGDKQKTRTIIKQLNGDHVFIMGCHDRWLKGNSTIPQIWSKRINGQLIVVCHYAMKVWKASHYNSWHLFGHSHGKLPSEGKTCDIGVDTSNFYPYSQEDIHDIMNDKPDNFNLIKNRKY